MSSLPDIPEWEYVSVMAMIIFLVLVGGLVAGLTIGLMSLDATNLYILKVSGTEKEKKYAAKIEPIRKNGHLLLVTLLLVNTIVNETLPILFGIFVGHLHKDALEFKGFSAVACSTILILIFGEILPQAICSCYGLQIGAFFAFPVQILIYSLSIVAYPIAKLLDYLLGYKHGHIYRHAGLKELVALHGEDQSGPLSKDEVSILRAVLDLRTKTVRDVMTHLSDVFMFSVSQKLDRVAIQKVMNAGHSRIPIYLGTDRNAILGTLLVKQLLLNDPDDETPLSSVKLKKLPRVCSDTPLFDMLHVFEVGASHMALVVDEISANIPEELNQMLDGTYSPRWIARRDHSKFKCLGIITLEDVIEELIGEETDVYVDMQTKTRVSRTERSPSAEWSDEVDERKQLLEDSSSSRPVNPNSALFYRPIKLPSSIIERQQKKYEKQRKQKKRLFTPHDLLYDLYSDSGSRTSTNENSPSHRRHLEEMDLIPEIVLSPSTYPANLEVSRSL